MKKVLPRNEFWALMEGLISTRKVMGVVEHAPGYYKFDRLSSIDDVPRDYRPTALPPKKYLLPQFEALLRFNRSTGKAEVVEEAEDVVLFGVRPCDITSLAILTERMASGSDDPYFRSRREHTTIIGWDCQHPCDEFSFCESVDSLDPDYGYDLFIREVSETDIVVETGSPAGDLLMKDAGSMLTNGGQAKLAAYHADRRGRFPEQLTIPVSEAPLLFASEADSAHWEELGRKCLSCGSCTNVCPTCYCFDVADDLQFNLEDGERTRTWDSCQLDEFAAIASGENFREERRDRARHRLSRKFNYQYTRTGRSHCVGCGRCARQCLAHIDPKTTINTLAQTAAQARGELST